MFARKPELFQVSPTAAANLHCKLPAEGLLLERFVRYILVRRFFLTLRRLTSRAVAAAVSASIAHLFWYPSRRPVLFPVLQLTTYRPHLLHLPTTNGEHCTGDVTNMGKAIGAITIDLGWVLVHPTGLVKAGLKRTWDQKMSTGLMGGRPSLVSKLFVLPLVFFFSLASSTAPRRSSRVPPYRCRWLNWSASLSRRSLAVV